MDIPSTLGLVHARYLASPAALAAGIACGKPLPAVADVPRVAESESTTMEYSRPSIVVEVDYEDSEQTRNQKFANIRASLKVLLGKEAKQTTDAVARQWLEAIQAALMNQAAWRAYIVTADLALRTGWRIADRWQLPPLNDRDEDKNTLSLTAVIRIRLAVSG